MKRLKRILTITITMSIIMCSFHAIEAQAGYGTDLTVKTMSGRVVDGSFEDYMTEDTDATWKENTWPFSGTFFDDLNGTNFDMSRRKDVAYITDAKPRNGKNSLAVDFNVLSSLSSAPKQIGRILMQQDIPYTKTNTKFYIEAWAMIEKASLLDESQDWSTPVNIRVDDYGNGGKYANAFGTIRSTSEADEKGWRKVVVKPITVGINGGHISIGPGVINYHETNNGLGIIYFDDIRIFEYPKSISADVSKKVYDFDDAVDLSKIKMYGTDNAGTQSEFVNYGNIVYSVESGDAEIRDGKLYYKGSSDGEVTLKASFLDLNTNITFYFGSPIKISNIQKNENGSYAITASSVTGDSHNATIIVAVFDSDNLMRKIKTETKSIGTLETFDISAVDVSDISSPTVKIFIWDSISGMSPQADVTVK